VIAPLTLGWLVGVLAMPPVRIERCQISTPTVVESGDDTPSKIVGDYSLRIRFVDTANLTISSVTFRLNDGIRVVDAGTFSPSIAIDHTLRLPQTEATTCAVTSVTFTDGESWSADLGQSAP
jgi:hypothetical protein